MQQYLISVIIPTFNRAHLIRETLNSVLSQTYENWECIVVDDGSTDDTTAVLHEYLKSDKCFSFFQRPENRLKGPSSCRNFGLEKAKGDFVLFLDSDDLLSIECLSNRLEFVQRNLHNDFFIFKTELFINKIGDLNKIFNMNLESYSDKNYFNLFLEGLFPFCVSSVLWKADKIKFLKGFDEKMLILEDPELHLRAFKNDFKSSTCLTIQADNFYRKGIRIVENKKQNQEKLLQTVYYLFSRYLKSYPLQMKNYALNFYRLEILLKSNLNFTLRFYKLYFSSGILDFKQHIIILVLILYKILKIDKIKGLGFYKLTTKYIKQ